MWACAAAWSPRRSASSARTVSRGGRDSPGPPRADPPTAAAHAVPPARAAPGGRVGRVLRGAPWRVGLDGGGAGRPCRELVAASERELGRDERAQQHVPFVRDVRADRVEPLLGDVPATEPEPVLGGIE